MNNKRRFFIFFLILITGSSAFLFAKARLDKGTHYVIYAGRGEITAITHSPNQGRIVLTEVHDTVTTFPPRGKPGKADMRPFLTKWPDFDPKGAVTFQSNKEDVHLELTLSKPYYDPARGLMSFDIRSKSSLIPFNDVYEVNLYIYE